MDEKDFIELEDKHRGIQKEYKTYERLISNTIGEVIEMNEILIAEIRRSKDEYKSLKESHFVYFAENITLKKERDYLNQAIEALEEENKRLQADKKTYRDLYTTQNIKNSVYKSALEFYGKWTSYPPYSIKVEQDRGQVATKALEVEANE